MPFRILATSESFVLGHLCESVEVINMNDNSIVDAGDHYGEPMVGLITPDERWFITGGEGLQCYSAETGLIRYFHRGCPPLAADCPEWFWFVHGARLESPHVVRILINPWCEFASVWQLDLDTGLLTRLREGPFLAGTPYQSPPSIVGGY